MYPPSDDLVFMPGATVVGGYGHGLANSAVCFLVAREGAIGIWSRNGSMMVSSQVDELVGIAVGGPGRVTTGGGFVGGGFGIEGALEGIGVAAILNAVTTKTSVNTLLRITHPNWELILHTSQVAPDDLDLRLSPVLGRLRAREHRVASGPVRSDDLVAQLSRLADLHASGALTNDEFIAAKAQLLSSP
jgi:hypothetical protein